MTTRLPVQPPGEICDWWEMGSGFHLITAVVASSKALNSQLLRWSCLAVTTSSWVSPTSEYVEY